MDDMFCQIHGKMNLLIYGINAIFSYDAVLYFLGLCKTVPSICHITVCRGYKG